VFASGTDGTFRLTPLADTLRTDAPVSMRAWALFIGSPEHWDHWSHLVDSVRTGEPAVPDAFALFESSPEYGAAFNGAMTTISNLVREPVLAACDFSRFRTVVDVGGGHGSLLAGILQRTPTAQGVLFDLPSVTAGASDVLRAHGVEQRCRVESGSFFDSVPAGGDAYLLKNIVHDWEPAKALAILRNVRAAIEPDGRLLLVELVIPEGDGAYSGKFIDLEMLLIAGGRERTLREYREFLPHAGFELTDAVRTASPVWVLECTPR
jgi:hypothetical protein